MSDFKKIKYLNYLHPQHLLCVCVCVCVCVCTHIQVHLNKLECVEKFIYFSNSTQIVKLVLNKLNAHRLK